MLHWRSATPGAVQFLQCSANPEDGGFLEVTAHYLHTDGQPAIAQSEGDG